MEQIRLGKTEIQCSRILFGAWAIGGWMWGGSSEQDAIEAIHASLDNGVNAIDTAPLYGMGLSETLVGKAIKGRRDKVIIATKCGMRWDTTEGSDPWVTTGPQGKPVTVMSYTSVASILLECENSLRRLGVDVIDLYQIHWPDTSSDMSAAWEAMGMLKKQGKVRAIGVSNYSLTQLREAEAIYPVDTLQSPYSLIRKDLEDELIPYCKKHHITTLAYSPLERGLLTGKMTSDRHLAKNDHRASSPTFSLGNRNAVNEALRQIEPIARRHKATVSQVIIACSLALHTIDTVIVGARNAAQAKENAMAGSIHLTKEDVAFVGNILNPTIVELT